MKSQQIKKIFFTKNSKYNIKEKVIIILSPEFYWVRIFDIPINSIKNAKKLLPSLFEDYLEERLCDKLSYQIKKIQSRKYLCFAFDNMFIQNEIKKSGINIHYVDSFYFAQNELNNHTNFFYEENKFSFTDEKILVKIPFEKKDYFINIKEYINDIKLSDFKVNIKYYNTFISTKNIYFLSLILLVFLICNIFKSTTYYIHSQQLNLQIKKLRNKANFPISDIKLDSLLRNNNLTKIKENKKRELFFFLSKLNLKQLNYKNNILNATIENSNRKILNEFLKNKFKILSINEQFNLIYIKVEL